MKLVAGRPLAVRQVGELAVSQRTVSRILRVAAEVGFSPNPLARVQCGLPTAVPGDLAARSLLWSDLTTTTRGRLGFWQGLGLVYLRRQCRQSRRPALAADTPRQPGHTWPPIRKAASQPGGRGWTRVELGFQSIEISSFGEDATRDMYPSTCRWGDLPGRG